MLNCSTFSALCRGQAWNSQKTCGLFGKRAKSRWFSASGFALNCRRLLHLWSVGCARPSIEHKAQPTLKRLRSGNGCARLSIERKAQRRIDVGNDHLRCTRPSIERKAQQTFLDQDRVLGCARPSIGTAKSCYENEREKE